MVLLGAGQQCDDILVMQRAQLPQDLDFLAEQTLRFGEAFLRDAFDRNGEMFLPVPSLENHGKSPVAYQVLTVVLKVPNQFHDDEDGEWWLLNSGGSGTFCNTTTLPFRSVLLRRFTFATNNTQHYQNNTDSLTLLHHTFLHI